MQAVPIQIQDFLIWFKSQSEAFFASDANKSAWSYRAQWQGLPHSEIDELEKRYQIQFSPEHRLFLHMLHTLDKKEPQQRYFDDGSEKTIYRSFCHDWRDATEMAYWLNWPLREISADIAAESWLDSWGEEPKDSAAKVAKFQILYQNAPKVLPIFAHRFVVNVEGSPVISIWGMDTILYGRSLADYLLSEFAMFVSLTDIYYDEEDDCERSPSMEAFQAAQKQLFPNKIPFWADFF